MARALNMRGMDACARGRAGGGAAIAEALDLFRAAGDQMGAALALLDLRIPAYLEGDRERAVALCEEALARCRELGNACGISLALRSLADSLCDRGDAQRAASLYRESLSLPVGLGDRWGVADSLSGLAGVAGSFGRPEAAARLFGAAEALYEACRVCLPPPDRPTYPAAVTRARGAMDERAWAAAWEAGRSLPLDAAVAAGYALADAA